MHLPEIKNQIAFGFEQLLNLFYPNLCIVCEHRTHSKEELFCLDCQYHIHPTEMYKYQNNEFTAHFKGRIDLVNGAALYYYVKGGRIQKAIELLKYKNRPDIGIRLGRFYGSLLKKLPQYSDIDLILPVPLHSIRKIQRGYNQSSLIANGISESLNVMVREDILKRNKATYTQTEKNRMERISNMQKVFEIEKTGLIQNRHILLVDDILTTGATLEACASLLIKSGSVKISMVTLAMAT